MNVEQIMTPNPATCRTSETMHDAAARMWDNDCGALPVLDESGQLLRGMLTDRDVCMAAYTQGKPLSSIEVEVGVSNEVFYVRPDTSVNEAERLMRRTQTRRLPVLDREGRVVGILSLSDIARTVGGTGNGIAKQDVADTLAAIAHPRQER